MYSGAKKYLVSHQLCKFSHLNIWEACNFHHRYTSTMTDKMRKINPENHIQQEENLTLEKVFSMRGLYILHLNLRSIFPKIEEIRLLSSNCKVWVLCPKHCMMVRLKKTSEIEAKNYVVIISDRNCKGRGICISVRSDIGSNYRSDLSYDEIEAVWLNILLPKCKHIIAGICYRPPDQYKLYELWEETCQLYRLW